MPRNEPDVVELETKKVVDFLNVVLASECTKDFEYALNSNRTMFSTEDGRHIFLLTKAGAKKYEELIDYVQGMKQWDRLSLKFVKDETSELCTKPLSDVVSGARGALPKQLSKTDVASIRELTKNFVSKLDREASQEWDVYLPLAGIEAISGNSLKIGHARLTFMNSAEMEALNTNIETIFCSSKPLEGDKGRKAQYEFIRERTNTLKDTVCAVYHITAEPVRAIEIAEEQTQDVLDLLSYFLSFEHHRDYKGAVRLQGERPRGHRTILLLSSAADKMHQANQLTGAYMPIQFSADYIEDMKRLGIFKLSAIIESRRQTKFHKTILAGIRWFAASKRQDTPEIEFVNLVTCLENCLTPDDKYSSIRASIAEGCAILLEDKLEERLPLRSRVLDIYDIRSKIVHGGATIANKQEKLCLDHLRVIAQGLLYVLIKRIDDFKDKDALLNWLTKQKLA